LTITNHPVIVAPHFDDYLKENKVNPVNLVESKGFESSQIYNKFVNQYHTGSTKNVFGLVNTSAFLSNSQYPESLQQLSLEIVHRTMLQAITRIRERRMLNILSEE